MKFVPLRQAAEITGFHPDTVRRKFDNGEIRGIVLKSGHRRIDVSDFLPKEIKKASTVLYARVSSAKQKDDLKRQTEVLVRSYPEAELVKEIGSGINFKRKGLQAVLERAMCGEVITLVVAYKDRLARFGFEIIEQVIKRNGGRVVVLNDVSLSPSEELVKDLCTIIHVFSCRLHGLRSYKDSIAQDKNISVR